jgi:hypothetical protein
MKKFMIVVLMLIACGGVGTAHANPWTMDLSGLGLEGVTAFGTSSIVQINELLNITNAGKAPTMAVQTLGGDGILNDGDTFTEFGTIQSLGVDGNAIFFRQASGAGPAFVYFSFQGLSGAITNYDDGGDGQTTIANYTTNIANDTFNLVFTPGIGVIKLFADTDTDPTNGAAELADLSVLAGTGIAPELSAGAVPNGTLDFSLSFNSVMSGVFSFESNLGSIIGLADVNSGVIGIGDNGTDLILDVENSGTFRVVPIPSSLLLLSGGLVGLAGLRRKFKE